MPTAIPYSRASSIPPRAKRLIRLREQRLEESRAIQSAYQLSSVAARILAARNFVVGKEAEDFINPTLKNSLPEPYELKNLEKACELVAEIVQKSGSIAICCDFDVDGLSGGAQIFSFLKLLGVKSEVFVPCRFSDGYGLNEKTVKEIAEAGFSLLITVDFGTTNVKELSLARKLGLKTIVIDHHHVADDGPPADIFINPNQTGCGFANKVLSAAGLAWYFVVGLRKKIETAEKIDAKGYLDLACLGTICDMVPLIGANRVIAKRGIELLGKSQRVGLKALIRVAGLKDIGCSDVGFGIGPRLNAAGRMVHGKMVIDLLTTDDTTKAAAIARELNNLNQERKKAEESVKEHAMKQFQGIESIPAALVAWNPQFHTGVLGIVAQRLVEHFYRPAVVMGGDEPGIFKGSVRGIKGISVVSALEATSKYLVKYGGHEGAGGFSIRENEVEHFAQAFEDHVEGCLKNIETEPLVFADTEVALDDVSLGLIDELGKFAPFGMGNAHPQLLAKDLKVSSIKEINGGHLKMILANEKVFLTGLMWRQTSHPALAQGARVNVVFRPEVNSFGGFDSIQMNVQAVERA